MLVGDELLLCDMQEKDQLQPHTRTYPDRVWAALLWSLKGTTCRCHVAMVMKAAPCRGNHEVQCKCLCFPHLLRHLNVVGQPFPCGCNGNPLMLWLMHGRGQNHRSNLTQQHGNHLR
jgi:hypothetical protein